VGTPAASKPTLAPKSEPVQSQCYHELPRYLVKKFKARLRISRLEANFEKPTFEVEILDAESRLIVAQMQIPAEDFAMALTGVVSGDYFEGESQLSDERLGKKKVTKLAQLSAPMMGYDRKAYKEYLINNYKPEEGWFLNSYLGSQNSISYPQNSEEGVLLTFNVYSYQ
jgi:hypothetical protein